MTAAKLDFSVVICAYSDERRQDLAAAIESVGAQTIPAAEIIVVIDHNESLLEQVKSEEGQRISNLVVIPNSRTRGLSGARNSGVAAAGGNIIAFMDDDAIAAPDWLEQLAANYSSDVLGVGGPVEPLWVSGRPGWFPQEFDWVVGCTFRGMPEVTTPVSKLIGCNMSFRREVFATVGGFRSGIGRVGSKPIAGEETEFSIRVCQRWPDKTLVYEPTARMQHRVPLARSGWSYFRLRSYCEGISKALVAGMVGTADGLASERTYTTRTLPKGVLRGVADLALRRDPAGAARSAAIVAGLGITVYGYLETKIAERVNGFKNQNKKSTLSAEEHLI